MIEESGQVVGLENDFAWVEAERSSTCGTCAVRQGCGTSAIAKLLGRRRVRIRVLNHIDARIGDRVVIGITESSLVRGSLAVYAVPLAALFSGALAGSALGAALFGQASEVAGIAGALAGFAAGLVWLRYFSRKTDRDAAYQPVVLRHQVMSGDIQHI
ncbi:MAG: SoxR reducing system RseC family protein [Gammaproteobacteria bacterium]